MISMNVVSVSTSPGLASATVLTLAGKHMKGKAVAHPQDDDSAAMVIDTEEPEPNVADLIKQGKLSEASRLVFSAGALEMLENSEYYLNIFFIVIYYLGRTSWVKTVPHMSEMPKGWLKGDDDNLDSGLGPSHLYPECRWLFYLHFLVN